MIAGLPLGALEPASAKVFDWSLTRPAPDLGGVPFPGSGTIDASPTASTGVWMIDTIAGTVNGSEITGTSAFQGADNLLFTNGFAFVSTVGISFETAAGPKRQHIQLFRPGNAADRRRLWRIERQPRWVWRGNVHVDRGPRSIDLDDDGGRVHGTRLRWITCVAEARRSQRRLGQSTASPVEGPAQGGRSAGRGNGAKLEDSTPRRMLQRTMTKS